MSEPAPQPALGYSIGIVGHRADRIEDARQVRARVAEVLLAVEAALDEAGTSGFYPAGRRPLRLISALAEGADRIAASAALENGIGLDVVLPFVASEYRHDFADEASRDEFDKLVARADNVLILDGRGNDRQRAYEAAGMTLLDNCDLLIAVWDGGPGRGRGGTREVIEEAARRAIPLVVIDPAGRAIAVRSCGVSAASMRLDDVPELTLTDLHHQILAEVSASEGAESAIEWLRKARAPREPVIHWAYPLLLRLAGVRSRGGHKSAARNAPVNPPADPLRQAFAWWDEVAIRAAQAFRSAVIVNFALAALAVVLSAASLLVGDWKWTFVLGEVVTILLLLANTVSASRKRWQERWLEAREVAEMLRVCGIQRSVGIGRGIADTREGGLLGWYTGAFARSGSLENVDLSQPTNAAAPLIAEVRTQSEWNEATAHRMHLAAHRIERFGEVLFVAVLIAAVGWLMLDFVLPHRAFGWRFALTAVTAGFPALATASYGIRVILDFEGIAGRSSRMSSGLNAVLAKWQNEAPSAARLQNFARSSADIMLGDIAAWRLLTEGRRLSLPG